MVEAIEQAELIVICPSNPFISIWPILAVAEIREALERRRVPSIAVSPLVGGRAIKGPADRMLERLAGGTEPVRVAACYQGVVDALVLRRVRRGRCGGGRAERRARRRDEDVDAGLETRLPRSPGSSSTVPELRILPVEGLPEIAEGDDLGGLIAEAAEVEPGDVVVVSQKVVSKAEGRIVRLDDVEASDRARELAANHDPRQLEVILRESARVVRARAPLVIAETRHGFVCASAGVDASNAPEPDTLVLLPLDPDASAAAIRRALRERTGHDVGVIVSDSFGRPWRNGIVDVAIGVAGLRPLDDWRGRVDANGYELRATVVAVADEIAAAAELVRGKTSGVPVAIVRGLDVAGEGTAQELVMPPERDMFR